MSANVLRFDLGIKVLTFVVLQILPSFHLACVVAPVVAHSISECCVVLACQKRWICAFSGVRWIC